MITAPLPASDFFFLQRRPTPALLLPSRFVFPGLPTTPPLLSVNQRRPSKRKSDDEPLYCNVCRVSLNAPAQAKQHYEGKNHAKRVRLHEATTKLLNKSEEKPQEKAPSADVYCAVCDVSFNSTKQAQQHYGGKNHAKRTKGKVRRKGDGPKKCNCDAKFACIVCDVRLNDDTAVRFHVRLQSHLQAVEEQKKIVRSLQKTEKVDIDPILKLSTNDKRDSSTANYKLPSGQFYCPTCKASFSNENDMSQHVRSRRHRYCAT